MYDAVSRRSGIPEYMELVIFRLALLTLIIAGVSVMTSIQHYQHYKVLQRRC